MLIEALFPDLAPGEFIDSYYPDRPYVQHGSVARLGELAGLPIATLDPVSAIERYSDPTPLVYRASGASAWEARQQAIELFRSGASVELANLHERESTIQRWLMTMRHELGDPDHAPPWCHAMVSAAGHGVPFHFDHIDVCVIQLVGRKRWWIAPNEHVSHPDSSCFQSGERARHLPGYFPSDLRPPEDSHEIELVPGSVVFLPRGWWHRTCAHEPSISLTISMAVPTVARFAMRALTSLVLGSPRARIPIVGVAGDLARRQAAAARLDDFLAELRSVLGRVRGEHFLPDRP